MLSSRWRVSAMQFLRQWRLRERGEASVSQAQTFSSRRRPTSNQVQLPLVQLGAEMSAHEFWMALVPGLTSGCCRPMLSRSREPPRGRRTDPPAIADDESGARLVATLMARFRSTGA